MQIKNMKTIEHDVAYELSLQIIYDTKYQKQWAITSSNVYVSYKTR